MGFPTFVCLNETWLPGIRAMRVIELPGYVLVSRLDRRNDSGWGGVALFARAGYGNCIIHVGDNTVAERSWHVLHTDRGPIAVAVWYRRRALAKLHLFSLFLRNCASLLQTPWVPLFWGIGMFVRNLGCGTLMAPASTVESCTIYVASIVFSFFFYGALLRQHTMIQI